MGKVQIQSCTVKKSGDLSSLGLEVITPKGNWFYYLDQVCFGYRFKRGELINWIDSDDVNRFLKLCDTIQEDWSFDELNRCYVCNGHTMHISENQLIYNKIPIEEINLISNDLGNKFKSVLEEHQLTDKHYYRNIDEFKLLPISSVIDDLKYHVSDYPNLTPYQKEKFVDLDEAVNYKISSLGAEIANKIVSKINEILMQDPTTTTLPGFTFERESLILDYIFRGIELHLKLVPEPSRDSLRYLSGFNSLSLNKYIIIWKISNLVDTLAYQIYNNAKHHSNGLRNCLKLIEFLREGVEGKNNLQSFIHSIKG